MTYQQRGSYNKEIGNYKDVIFGYLLQTKLKSALTQTVQKNAPLVRRIVRCNLKQEKLMGLFNAFKDYKKYKKAHDLAQLLYPRHPNCWTDRIVKLPENKYAGASGKLIHNTEIFPYAVYTEFEGAIEMARQLGYTVVAT